MTDADRQPPAGDWRRSAAAVAVLSFDVDAEAPILAEDDHYVQGLSTMSHQAYLGYGAVQRWRQVWCERFERL